MNGPLSKLLEAGMSEQDLLVGRKHNPFCGHLAYRAIGGYVQDRCLVKAKLRKARGNCCLCFPLHDGFDGSRICCHRHG